jgi:hypothetical protein
MKSPRKWLSVTRWVISVFFSFTALSSSLDAATIQSVSTDDLTLNVKLSREELEEMPWRGPILTEISSITETFTAPLMVRELQPSKSTVILVSSSPLSWAKRLMTVKFIPLFWDMMNSPLLLGPTQLHSFKKVTVGGGGGFIYEALGQRREDRERRRLSRAFTGRLDAVIPLSPDWLGLTIGAEYLRGSQDLTTSYTANPDGNTVRTSISETTELAKNTIQPGLWTPLGDDLRLGLRLDYTRLEKVTEGSDRKYFFTHELIEPQIGLTYFDPSFEGSMFFKWGDHSTDKSSSPVGGNMVEATSSIRTPSELWIMTRLPTPSLGLWGVGIGYMFYYSETQVDDAIMPNVTLPELLRAKLSWEKYLNHHSKIFLAMQYDGGKAPSPLLAERLANTASLTGGYQRGWDEKWIYGGQLRLEMGSGSLDQRVTDTNGKLSARKDKISTLGAEILMYVQRPLTSRKSGAS